MTPLACIISYSFPQSATFSLRLKSQNKVAQFHLGTGRRVAAAVKATQVWKSINFFPGVDQAAAQLEEPVLPKDQNDQFLWLRSRLELRGAARRCRFSYQQVVDNNAATHAPPL